MARRRNPITQWLISRASVGFAKLMCLLPLTVCRSVGRLIGRIAYRLVPRIRKVGLANLDLAYGNELTAADKVRILKGAAENVGLVAAEFSRIPSLKGAFLERQVTFKGLDNLDESKGALIIGGHLGNWEWMAPAMANKGYKVAEVVRPLDNAYLNAFVDANRSSGGLETIPKASAGLRMLELLKQGYLVGLLVDQSPRDNGCPATFFGEKCWATIGPVMVAARSKVAVHPVSMARREDGGYTLEIMPALPLEWSGSLRDDLPRNTQLCQDALEAVVRRYPEQWLWLHRRWKARPRLEEELKARYRGTKPEQD